jgi:hypothetical protein
MKIQCRTLFDCSRTGITGHYRASQVPFRDRTGRTIANEQDWNFARNQQRNWETILQMISLRTQPMNLSSTTVENQVWEFTFEVEAKGVYSVNADVNNMDALLQECNGIPMVTNLTEQAGLESSLIAQGSRQNIWFKSVNN